MTAGDHKGASSSCTHARGSMIFKHPSGISNEEKKTKQTNHDQQPRQHYTRSHTGTQVLPLDPGYVTSWA